MAHERGGLMASLGQSIVGPRFHETDEVFSMIVCALFLGSKRRSDSGSIDKGFI